MAIVLYHGDLSCDFIDDFAINLDKQDENGDVNIGQVLTLGKWKYSCYARTTDLLIHIQQLPLIMLYHKRKEEHWKTGLVDLLMYLCGSIVCMMKK